MKKYFFLLYFLFFAFVVIKGQEPDYDESKVPQYTLPDPLKMENGEKVKNKEHWIEKRRPEILSLFETHVYGKSPVRPENMHFEVLSEDRYTIGNMATRKEIAVYFTESEEHYMTILLYIPNKRTEPVPLFSASTLKAIILFAMIQV